jgi:hypothetical protein
LSTSRVQNIASHPGDFSSFSIAAGRHAWLAAPVEAQEYLPEIEGTAEEKLTPDANR